VDIVRRALCIKGLNLNYRCVVTHRVFPRLWKTFDLTQQFRSGRALAPQFRSA